MRDEVDLSFELDAETLCSGVFTRQVIEEGRSWLTSSTWTSETPAFLDRLGELDSVEPLIRKSDNNRYECAVFYTGGCLVYLQLSWSNVFLRIAGEREPVGRVEEWVRELLPEAHDEESVTVAFWYWATDRGFARKNTRVLKVPAWGEIASNYPRDTSEALDRLIQTPPELDAGQLLLWFGPPGCGKTYALRSLLRAWRDRLKLHYISDAERFFANSDYMLGVLLEEDGDTEKLLVLEDAGEFLLPDARQQMGQGLSRLLNASDGLIGQGLKSTFLITTNEEVGRLHPAVSRAGRCAVQIEFDTFTRSEASQWLAEHGVFPDELPNEVHLADLYALCRGVTPVRSAVKVGF